MTYEDTLPNHVILRRSSYVNFISNENNENTIYLTEVTPSSNNKVAVKSYCNEY